MSWTDHFFSVHGRLIWLATAFTWLPIVNTRLLPLATRVSLSIPTPLYWSTVAEEDSDRANLVQPYCLLQVDDAC